MCGLVGVAGFISNKEEKVFRNMLVFDTIRGEDSTGVASVKSNGEVEVCKEVGNPYNLFRNHDYIKSMRWLSRALIGHNRYATFGGISKETAHPFDIGNIVGVHNGTLRNKHILDNSHSFKVDSENLFHHINKHGLEHAINDIDGAYSLVWWNKRTDTLNFLRNKERPMWLSFTQDNKTVLWASEKWMIEIAAENNKLLITPPVSTEVDMHYRIKIVNLGQMEKPIVKEVKSSFIPPKSFFTPGSGSNSNFKPLPKSGYQGIFKKTLSLVSKKQTDTVVFNKHNYTPIFIANYLKTKNMHVEVCAIREDSHGSKYISLMDFARPEVPIRLYLNRKEKREFHIGQILSVNIGTWSTKLSEGSFFKADTNSVKVVLDAANDAETKYSDGNNHLLSKKDWETKFSNCGWCFDMLYAEDHGNRLTDTGDCVCGKCAADPEVLNNFSLKTVY